MYGIVNVAIEDLILDEYGYEKWEAIKKRSALNIDIFIGSQPYDDDVTYKLVVTSSEILEVPVDDLLKSFGEWWILKTAREKYGALLSAGGSDFSEFMNNLPRFHDGVSLIYPKLQPPEFRITDKNELGMNLHYYSKREGLQYFLYGVITGLGKLFSQPIHIEITRSRTRGDDHEVYNIRYAR